MTDNLDIAEEPPVKASDDIRLWDDSIACEIVDAETGRIIQWINPVYSQLQQQAPIGSGTFIAYGQHDKHACYYPDGVLAERPVLWPSEPQELGVGETLSLDAPAGSNVSYIYPSAEHRSGFLCTNYDLAADETFAFETAVPGEYRLILRPPFPYQRQELRLVVS